MSARADSGASRPLMVALLLEFGADRSVTDRRGRTPLDLARAGGHVAVEQLLGS